MQIPKRTKYRRYHKIIIKKKEVIKTKLIYGTYGIKAISNGYLRMEQMKRIKEDIVKKLKGKVNIFFNFYPLYGLTNKGTARMGSGKGDISDWYVPVKIGKVLIEFTQSKVSFQEIEKVIRSSAVKWPIKIIITEIKRNFDEKN